jgi:hypothetical protein
LTWQDVTAPPGSGISTLNGLSVTSQSFATSTNYGGFTITSSGSTHTFNLPGLLDDINGLATTTGNIMVANGTTWVAKGVGTNGKVLMASSTATGGVSWETPATGGVQTPWAQDVDAANFILSNIGNAGTDFITSTGGLTLAGLFTANAGISIGAQALTGTTGLINYTNFDVDASGNVDIGGTFTAGSGGVQVTDAAGKVQHDSIVDCADTEILKWTTAGGWACAADATGGGGGVTTLLGETTLGGASSTLNVSLSGASEYMSCVIAGPAATATGTIQMRFDSDSGAAAYGWTTGQQIAGAAFTDTQDASDSEIALTGTATPSTDFIFRVYFDNVSGSVKTLSWDGTVGKAVGTIHDLYVGAGNYYTTAGQIDTSVNFFRNAGNYGAGTYAFCEGKNVADYAENYYTKDRTTQAAEVVIADSSLPAGIQKASKPYDSRLIGIISTNPAIVLDDGIGFPSGRPVPVALSGRVPVKVSNTNGAIQTGDLLTSSEIPGVAMKATKAGAIIGQALESYDGADIGKIMVFVKTTYWNGQSSASFIFREGDVPDTNGNTNSNTVILDHLVNEKFRYTNDNIFSEITTDRLIAGLEIISPRVLTDTLVVNSIEPVDKDIILKLVNGGKLIFESSSTPIVTIDDLGNALLSGGLTVGSREKPSGITLFDTETGEPYCVKIAGGSLVSVAGECAVQGILSQPEMNLQAPPGEIAPDPSADTSTTTPSQSDEMNSEEPTGSGEESNTLPETAPEPPPEVPQESPPEIIQEAPAPEPVPEIPLEPVVL